MYVGAWVCGCVYNSYIYAGASNDAMGSLVSPPLTTSKLTSQLDTPHTKQTNKQTPSPHPPRYHHEPTNQMFHHFEYIGDDFEADMATLDNDETIKFWWT